MGWRSQAIDARAMGADHQLRSRRSQVTSRFCRVSGGAAWVGERLRRSGVTCQDFRGEQTDEPSVIGWMPSAQLYFRDPDGHSIEFIALLDDTPEPSFIGSLSEWRKRPNQAMQRTAGRSDA